MRCVTEPSFARTSIALPEPTLSRSTRDAVGARFADVLHRGGTQTIFKLLQVEAARLDVFAERFPVPVRPARKSARLLLADEPDRPILRGRRLLTNQTAFAIPRQVIRARPAVA